jgi:1A family penicillin-binding protein
MRKRYHKLKAFLKKRHVKNGLILALSLAIFFSGIFILWISTLKIPDLSSFEKRKIAQSTKIYDRTGEIALYDIHEDAQRTIVAFEDISRNIKNATVAIEDAEFYDHKGIKPKSILRAIIANITTGGYSQGGSTITQQVIKKSVLTDQKTITRKIKEWVLALKLERILTKDQILALYLNEVPYGGNMYGVEEASKTYFGKDAKDVTLAEAAYIAALPQAPSYYSPYGNHKDKLVQRKNLVLKKMLEYGFITQGEYRQATQEEVAFLKSGSRGIKAPHFVLFVKDLLIERYGEQAVEENGYRVITTLDYSLQQKAEEIVKKYALENEKGFNAENAALTAVDPKTGDILVMVGSRDYFDKNIDGNFNITIAHRQPGSSFKPFVYAAAFNKGYTPDTVLFDVPTEFSTSCNPDGTPKFDGATCYKPKNYDDKFFGPLTIRQALAQSRNVPAVKALYLAGLSESLRLAKDMGIDSLTDINRYGLTLVLGGGEVSLLDMTGAYGVFANDGVRLPHRAILRVEDNKGNVIEEFTQMPTQVVSADVARQISSILSDNNARFPAFDLASPLYFPGRDVAAKTGTTNDYRDAWIIGYTPQLAVGAWAGNNDNSPMEKKVAGYIVAPLWNAFMKEALATFPNEPFRQPEPIDQTIKPILRGIWQGNQIVPLESLGNDKDRLESRQERIVPDVHSILYWVDKNDPRGPIPENPYNDPQFSSWEYGVKKWISEHPLSDSSLIIQSSQSVQSSSNSDDDSNTNTPFSVRILNPARGTTYNTTDNIPVNIDIDSKNPIRKVEFYIDHTQLGETTAPPYSFSFTPKEFGIEKTRSTFKVIVYDTKKNKTEATVSLRLRD